MIIKCNFKFGSWPLPAARIPGLCLLAAVFLFTAYSARAQEAPDESEPLAGSGQENVTVQVQLLPLESLPQVAHLAAALADMNFRTDTLLTLVAVRSLLEYASPVGQSDLQSLQSRFNDERAWLQHLTWRFSGLPIRGSQLDSAAWFVAHELAKHNVVPGPEVSPLGPEDRSLMRQLFDRTDERLAAAVLPEVLRRTETQSSLIWMSLLEAVEANNVLLAAVSGLHTEWFSPWMSVEPPAGPLEEDEDVILSAAERLTMLAGSSVRFGPAAEFRLRQLRFDLLSSLPSLEEARSKDARYLLVLASAVDGLNDGRYLAFTESLLWVISELLLEEQVSIPRSAIPGVLSELLPLLSNTLAGEFSAVDPRINATLAAVYDAVQFLQGDQYERARMDALRRNIGDSVAQLVLLIPDLNYYFEQPVRRSIADQINLCIAIASNPGFSKDQFDNCMRSLVEMSGELISREELSGDSDGPFGTEQLRRELMLPPWQRINFLLGYMNDHFPTGCDLPAGPLPNPLEWSSLATVITWLARQSPVYFQTPENEALLLEMRQHGLDLVQDMAQQVDCISGEGTGIDDPVRRSLVSYRLGLGQLARGIRDAELEFRNSSLKPGADVVFHSDASQRTAYRSSELTIGPCDPERVCEMSGTLEATRALIGLFPDPYLIADQTGLGSLEICYQNMQWVNRRAAFVRPEDPHVANYFGKLSFDLVGRYRENGEAIEIFGSTIVSPDEYHYLFAAATDEVLEDSCPTEWVGSRIVTPLSNSDGFRVVPNRLTYLAAARKRPSEVIEANWSRGSEWRDWFVTGLGVKPIEFAPDDSIAVRVNQHLQSLYQAEQSMIYAALLRPQSRNIGGEAAESLQDLQEELTTRKALVRSYVSLFYPGSMMDSDRIRGSLEGYDSLLDLAVLRRFRESGAAVSSINNTGIARLDQLLADWNRQPEAVRRSGTVAVDVAHAIIRLDTLYQEFFVLPSQGPDSRAGPSEPAFSFD